MTGGEASLLVPITASLRQAAPGVDVVDWKSLGNGSVSGAGWWILSAPPYSYGGSVDLTAGLKQANVDVTALLAPPSPAGACLVGRCPLQVVPVALDLAMVRVRVDVLTALGIPVPKPTWTLDDFVRLCATVDAALKRGKLAKLGVDRVLFPQASEQPYDFGAGDYLETMTVGSAYWGSTLLWQAFVAGFGGNIVNGGVHWDQGAAYDGIVELLSIASRFGAGPSPSDKQAGAAWSGSAMAFVQVNALPPVDHASSTRLLPFPQMPVRPVAPASLQYQFVLYGRVNPTIRVGAPVPFQGAEAIDQQTPPRTPTEQAQLPALVQDAGEYFAWRVGDQAQRLFASLGLVPVARSAFVSDPNLQAYGLAGAPDQLLLEYLWPGTRKAAVAFDQLALAMNAGMDGDTVALKAALAAFSSQMNNVLGTS